MSIPSKMWVWLNPWLLSKIALCSLPAPSKRNVLKILFSVECFANIYWTCLNSECQITKVLNNSMLKKLVTKSYLFCLSKENNLTFLTSIKDLRTFLLTFLKWVNTKKSTLLNWKESWFSLLMAKIKLIVNNLKFLKLLMKVMLNKGSSH